MSTIIDQNDLIDDVVTDMGDSITASGALGYVGKSIRRLNRRLHITSTSGAISVNASGIITASNEEIVDILCLQIECLIVKTSQGNAISKGIKIKSGSDSVDTTASFGGFQNLVGNVCGELKNAITDYLSGSAAADSAIVDGGDVIWYGDQREYWEGEDYDNSRKNFKSPFDTGQEWD